MKIKNNLLTVFKNTTDISKSVSVFGQSLSLSLTTTDTLLVGFYKSISQIFIEIKTANSVSTTLVVEKWTGSAWESINILDETDGLSKSGFIFFDEATPTTESTQSNIKGFYYRIKVSANTASLVLNGINLVFCNLEDLKIQEPAIERFYPREINSHIFSMVAARDYILRRINNTQPFNYYSSDDGSQIEIRNFNAFDFFDINEIRDAAAYYTLHKIFSNRSDSTDDIYQSKSTLYLDKFEQSFKLFQGRKLTIDLINDGKESNTDKINSAKIMTSYR